MMGCRFIYLIRALKEDLPARMLNVACQSVGKYLQIVATDAKKKY